MSLGHGINQNNNGLTFYYDHLNRKKSYIDPPANNLASGNFFVGNNNFTVNTNVTDKMPDNTIGIARELNAQTVFDPNRTVSIGNYSLTAGNTYTLSFYVKNINCTGFSGNLYSPTLLRVISGITYPTVGTSYWSRVIKTFTVPDEGTNPVILSPQVFRDGGIGLFRLTWLMLEEGERASTYTPNERNNTQVLYDLTKNNTITATELTYNSDSTFKFNGSSNYITLSDQSIPIYNSSYTIEAWIKRETINENHGIIGDLQYDYQAFYINSSNKLVSFHRKSDSVNNSITSLSSILTNWTHVAVVFDITSGKRLYINGILDNTNSNLNEFGLNPQTYPNRGPKYIGRSDSSSFGTSVRYFNGEIGIIKGYSRALTSQEILNSFTTIRKRYL